MKKIQRRDLPWVDAYVAVLIGPFVMPSVDQLRTAVAALAERYPDSRLSWSQDLARRSWGTDRNPESIVVERDWDESAGVGAQLDLLINDATLDPPLTLVRYPRHLGLKMSHSVGDGRLFLTVIAATLITALTGQVVPWPVEPGGRFPLLQAAVRTFGRHPGLALAAIRDRIPPAVEEAHSEERPWAPSRRTHHAEMPREMADEIFSWGKAFAPRASRFAIQVTLVLKALEAVGFKVSNDVRVISDLRRYLGWKYIDGNFVAGVPMALSSDMTAEKVSAIIKSTNESGRPLAGQILTTLRGGVDFSEATTVDIAARPRVTFTNMGRSPVIDNLPFLADEPAVYAGSIPPEGPLGLTVLTGETSRVLTIDTTFHDNVVDYDVIDEAMRLIVSDPITLLAGKAGSFK